MKKRILAAAMAAAMVCGLAACGSSSSSSSSSASAAGSSSEAAGSSSEAAGSSSEAAGNDAAGAKVGETVLKVSFNQTLENPEAKTLLEMSDALYDATEGRYSMEVYPSEQLGNQQESLELVQAGAIDMALVANSLIENVNSDFAIIGTPYVYDNEDHQQRVFESDALDELFATTADNNFYVLAAYSLGPRCLYTKELITTPEELSGKKIRVMQSDTMIQMMNLMGGVGTAMSQGDVYSAIQQGTLDGAENNIITYVDLLQYEVAPYYTLTKHLMIPDELIINSKVFEGMSEADQAALKKVAKESVTTAFTKCAELRQTYYDKAEKELGVTITEVDITPFQENCQELIDSIANRSDMTKDIYKAIQSFK